MQRDRGHEIDHLDLVVGQHGGQVGGDVRDVELGGSPPGGVDVCIADPRHVGPLELGVGPQVRLPERSGADDGDPHLLRRAHFSPVVAMPRIR
ncbi:hypothetical protein EXU48_20435 [Occultella glacieicola]|uniref:Uncharacterized protein n=1 Tax=Occultella glacieicola TaxID=2518684 RepID=A0ABY2DYH8_9MICO|nr:hypothetical protein EXU48_20435 [Occultella glacieicola]